jgi:tetratricopeptide (TPR) repeat protein
MIELAPTSDAYVIRGHAYYLSGSFEAALSDYQEANRLNPNSAPNLDRLGKAYADKGDYDSAIASYTDAIKLYSKANKPDPKKANKPDPEYAFAFAGRGDVYAAKQDYNRAIAEYNQAIKLVPDDAGARARVLRHRGVAYEETKDYRRAIADYNEAVRLDADAYWTYSVLWFYLAQARSGDPKAAADELKANAQKLKQQDWPYPAVELFLGKQTPEEIVRTAPATAIERCDAKVYSGEWNLLHGDRAKAAEALKAAVSTCPKGYSSYGFARAELQRLEPQQHL